MKSFFISSTFKDMQAERDLMHHSIFPDLRRELKKYNEDIQELDLRWGVDTSLMTEEESGQHVIETCIDSIDRCRPYMVILVGERYGWIPNSDLVKSSNDQRLIACYEEPVSITQMEIMYGALSQETLSRCIFCFRDERFSEKIPEKYRSIYQSESTHHAEKLRLLKEKIRSHTGAKIIEYTPVWDEDRQMVSGLESFSTQLYKELWEMLQSELEDKTSFSPEERVLLQSQSTAERYLASYIPRSDCNIASSTTGRNSVLYHGTGGCGKSAFLSSIYQGCTLTGIHTFLYYCGNENCGNSDTFLNTLLYWLKSEFGETFTDADRSLNRSKKILMILELLKRPRHCDRMLLIDAIDQMEDDLLPVLSQISKAIIRETVDGHTFGMAVTALDSYVNKHQLRLKGMDFSMRKLNEMGETEIIAISQLHANQRGKHLDQRTQDAIRNKKSSKNPYYLTLLLQQLFMMDGEDFQKAEALAPEMEGLSLYMEQFIQHMPDDITEMTLHTLQFSMKKMEKHQTSFQKDWNLMDSLELFSLIALSKNGLTLQQLDSIAKSSEKLLLPMEIQRLFSLLYDAFHESNTGCWDFSHRLLRESIRSHLKDHECQSAFLHLSQLAKRENQHCTAFYYALRSEQLETISDSLADILSMDPKEQRAFFDIYREYLQESKKNIDFQALHLNKDLYGWFLANIILSDPEPLIAHQQFWLNLLQKADDPQNTVKTKFYMTLAHLYLLQFEERTQDFEKYFRKCKELFHSFESFEKEDLFAYASLLISIRADIHQGALAKASEEELCRLTETPEYSTHFTEYHESLCHILKILDTWKHIENEEELQNFVNDLTEIQKGYDITVYREFPDFEKRIYHFFLFMTLEAANKFCSLGKYKSVLNTCSVLNGWITICLSDKMSIHASRLYLYYLNLQIYSTLPEYAIKKMDLYQKQCESLLHFAPTAYFKRLFADSHVTRLTVLHKLKEAKSHSSSMDFDINNTIKNGLSLYEELLEGKTDDEKELFLIEEYNFLYYYLVTSKLEEKIFQWKNAEADLENALKYRILQYKKSDSYDNLFGIGWSYSYILQYYDYMQDTEKLNLLVQRFLTFMNELEELDKPDKKGFTKLKFYLEIAEALCRHNCTEKLPALVEKCTSLVQHLQQNNTKHVPRLVPHKVRIATIRLKAHLFTDLADAINIYSNAVILAQSLTDEEVKLLSDLHQTMGEISYEYGSDAFAIEQLEKSRNGFAKPGFISAKDNESVNQKNFRFYQGQLLLSRLTKDLALLTKTCRFFRWLLMDYTRDKDVSHRPLLLAEAKKAKDIYDTCFPDENISDTLLDILLENEANRKAHYWKIHLEEETRAMKVLTDWEAANPGSYTDEYVKLIKDVSQIQDKLVDNMIKNSTDHKELWFRQIELIRRYITHYLENKDYYTAFKYVSLFIRQTDYRKEWTGEYYSDEFCMTYFEQLILFREAAPYKNRIMQVNWLDTVEFGSACCQRMYEKTRDLSWIYKALKILKEHREYMEPFKKSVPEDRDWLIEYINNLLSDEQQYYLMLMQSGCAAEQEWFPPLLQSVEKQLQNPLILNQTQFCSQILSKLYTVQVSDPDYKIELQKCINHVTIAQNSNDSQFYFYIQKAAKELPSDATMEQLMDYINKLKEGKTS